ncbi:MAG: hypothetical protein LBK12_06380 [Odoribacteraceae bacterium]|jgi:hypothetical protein|nr:hypothetical protein [Odoribacteraceae bacterium]
MLRRRKKRTPVPFVPGIHDYCDQWCERCALAARCLHFAIERKAQEMTGGLDLLSEEEEEEEIGEDFAPPAIGSLDEEILDEEILNELARDLGVPVEALSWEDELSDFREDLEDAENEDENGEASLVLYEEDVYTCFCLYERLIDEYQETLYSLIDTIEEVDKDIARVDRVEDLLAGINWHLDLLFAKLKRAYYASSLHALHGFQSCRTDADGSAKLVLLLLDASCEAWGKLCEELSTSPREISWLRAVLDQMRVEVQAHFPSARLFKRPGFDD